MSALDLRLNGRLKAGRLARMLEAPIRSDSGNTDIADGVCDRRLSTLWEKGSRVASAFSIRGNVIFFPR